MEKDTLSIIDQRTKAGYGIPLFKGTVRAMDLRQIKADPEDFLEHSLVPDFDHVHRWR
jgi:citrate synthase